MNRFTSITLKKIAAALLFGGFSSLAFATTTVMTVNGMVCAFCAQGIEKRLSRLPETKGVFVDLKKKIVAVEAKDGMTHDKKLLESEIKDAGYEVTKIEDSHHPLQHIKASAIGKK